MTDFLKEDIFPLSFWEVRILFELCKFYLATFIPNVVQCSAFHFTMSTIFVFAVFALVVNLMRGKGVFIK